jgi:hypothetical protein
VNRPRDDFMLGMMLETSCTRKTEFYCCGLGLGGFISSDPFALFCGAEVSASARRPMGCSVQSRLRCAHGGRDEAYRGSHSVYGVDHRSCADLARL